MILIIDNYDSFTYNLYQLIGQFNPDVKVYRNDAISAEQAVELEPSHIVISPGPGFPDSAGISVELVRTAGKAIPILGVCLGHQAIGEAYGGKTVHAEELMHGKASEISIVKRSRLFDGLPEKFNAGRYHSLVVEENFLPRDLIVTARAPQGEIMAFEHRAYPVFGIQFHPESILTPCGGRIIENFLSTGRRPGGTKGREPDFSIDLGLEYSKAGV